MYPSNVGFDRKHFETLSYPDCLVLLVYSRGCHWYELTQLRIDSIVLIMGLTLFTALHRHLALVLNTK